VPELEIDGLAEVTAVLDCPPIAEGEGRVVTGRFVTREAVNVVTVRLANGTEIRATDVHPVWSVDREDWVPAGKLEPGERVDTLGGPVAVANVERLESRADVHNIEVHGEHVFRVTADGVLVHNAGPVCGTGERAALSELLEAGSLRIASTRSPLVSQATHADHHVFTKWRASFFSSRYGISVDDFTITIDSLTHEAIHAGKQALGNSAGWWDDELMGLIRRAEWLKNGALSADEVLDIGRQMLSRFRLGDWVDVHPYLG